MVEMKTYRKLTGLGSPAIEASFLSSSLFGVWKGLTIIAIDKIRKHAHSPQLKNNKRVGKIIQGISRRNEGRVHLAYFTMTINHNVP